MTDLLTDFLQFLAVIALASFTLACYAVTGRLSVVRRGGRHGS